jgi:hypothetical protein
VYDKVPRLWSTLMLWAGVKVRFTGSKRWGEPHIFASNHVSWFDVPAAKILPRYKFVAAESSKSRFSATECAPWAVEISGRTEGGIRARCGR